ncbi:MAG: tetratricopeptide repeat protein [Burkholderiales bacterium]
MDEDSNDPAADLTLDEIVRLIQAGDWPAARVRCEALVARAPADADALSRLGQIAIGQYRWQDAIAAFDRALRLRVDPWTLGNLGVCHWKIGNLAEAEYCLRGAVELKPAVTRAHVSLANVLHASRRFDAALEELATAEKLDATDHQIPMRRGCALAALGRYDEAQQAFAHSIQLAGRFTYARLAAFDHVTFDAVSANDNVPAAPQLAAQAGAQNGEFRYVTLISCNPAYVRKYGFPFIRSFAERSGGASLLHLHVYDPDDAILDEIAAVIARSGVARYVVTIEPSPYAALEAQRRKAYYACGRLVHMPFWLDRYRCPVLSLDVDFIVEGALDGLIDAAAGHDAGLNPREPPDSPWLDVIANIIVANPTPAARHYFTAVKNYALACLAREPEAWLVDQSALYCILKMMERFAAPPAIVWLPAALQSSLWHIGHAYDHLLDDPRYRKYADPRRS